MQWADKIRRVRLVLIVAAVLLSVASLVVSHYLVRDLKREERVKMETWAEAMRSLGEADAEADLSLVLKVLNSNNTIPVKVVNAQGRVEMQRNVEDVSKDMPHKSLRIDLSEDEWLDVYYDDSLLLRRLALWPYVQLGIVAIFVIVAIYALLSSKKSEQNKVWVGLSKETAHQLGTPISSLMAWVEVLREAYPEDPLIPEMDKDVLRLQLIAERFSKIGSLPELKETDVAEVLKRVADYIRSRVSNKVNISIDLPEGEVVLPLCAPLFEWVIENLCKNAIDAMESKGAIRLVLKREAYLYSIEVSDTGKGIPVGKWKTVFMPGYTTKSRGWGLGLSLAKRIVEEYHQGLIFVKSSEPSVGTTFRIELKM
ncbi:MAG: HAMP domain-containing histidine kinase [Bacteroidaceae bacterium]|nr:HAMP domain-containing histidine kinase [Bacteroidaceae bacterium]